MLHIISGIATSHTETRFWLVRGFHVLDDTKDLLHDIKVAEEHEDAEELLHLDPGRPHNFLSYSYHLHTLPLDGGNVASSMSIVPINVHDRQVLRSNLWISVPHKDYDQARLVGEKTRLIYSTNL